MKIVLQKFVLPTTQKLDDHFGIFYHGDHCVTENKPDRLYIPAFRSVEFSSYMNGFPLNKWKKYTDIKGLELNVKVQGKFKMYVNAYALEPDYPVLTELYSADYDFTEPNDIHVSIPECSKDFIAFKIVAEKDTIFYGGEFVGEFDEVRDINLAISTTTCKKEKDIIGNINSIRERLLESDDDDVREHLFINVVDNGNTLKPEQIESYHIRLFPNRNTGGSGGYSRGMIETLHMTPKIDYVLLMDDDVIVIPESIRRTYELLRTEKKSYYDAFIAGGMLEYDAMFWLHEDIGSFRKNGDLTQVKGHFDISKLGDILNLNKEYPALPTQYAAWWYCCIPMTTVKKMGFSMPYFIRGDDSEYSLRCRPVIMTMSGIGIWHMGFGAKYNAAMDLYMILRNFLISKAIKSIPEDVDVIGRVDREFKRLMYEFCYDSAELVIMAVEDFLKGPDFLIHTDQEKLIKKLREKNEKMVPLDHYKNIEVRMNEIYSEPPMTTKTYPQVLRYLLTWNGQRFTSESSYKKGTPVIGYDWSWQPLKEYMHKSLLAVNYHDRTAHLRTMDKKRFNTLYNRYKKVMQDYKANIDSVTKKYVEARPYLTSEEFWRKYLGI